MKTKTIKSTSCILILAVTTLILHSTSMAKGLDVNDVSILFPIGDSDTQTLSPNISLGDGIKTPLMSKQLFKDIDQKMKAKSKVSTRAPYEHWKIVGFRYDPCFPKSSQEPLSCIQQIRLIAQPLNANGYIDLAMHLLYSVGEGKITKNDRIIPRLVKIRDMSNGLTTGRALTTHPGLSDEVQNKNIDQRTLSAEIKNFILDFCSENNLMELTFTDTDLGLNGPWFFSGGMIKNKIWTLDKIPQLPTKYLMQQTDESGLAKPLPSQNVGLGHLISDVFESGTPINPNPQQITELQRVENPSQVNPRNMDCASCHLAGNFLRSLQLDEKATKEFYRSPIGISGYSLYANHPFTDENNHGDNVRLFGYERKRAIVAPIVANSSAAIADYVNQVFSFEKPTQRNCSGQEIELRRCLLTEFDFNINLVRQEEDCFKKYCK